jgi:hypothetical protein
MPLKRDDFRMNHHRALVLYFGMIFSENRCTLFRIMPQASRRALRKSPRRIAALVALLFRPHHRPRATFPAEV